MKKALPVRDWKGNILLVYFLQDEKNVLIKENTFPRGEWEKGIAKWQWSEEVTQQIGKNWQFVGEEVKDLGSGYLYQLFFVPKDTLIKKEANTIIEESIRIWEQQR